jgi:hypothetical protein
MKENREGHTHREFDRATKARTFYHVVGGPTIQNFKAIIRMNTFKNCPVTVADVDLAEKIFGPDLGTIKGKSTRHASESVMEDLIEIPPELKDQHKDLTFCMDLMFVNGMPLFTGVDQSIKYRTAVPIKSRHASELFKAMDKAFRVYNKAGFTITTVHCDQEFKHIMDKVSDDLNVEMNYTTTGDHVPEAERNNRTLKERMRGTTHRLPFKAMPKEMLGALAVLSCQQLNFFQPRLEYLLTIALMPS